MRYLAAVLLTLALSSSVFGQASDGNLVGTVSDPAGAVVPGATVTVTNAATGARAVTKTTTSGEYRFNNLPVGRYDLQAEAAGFTIARLGNVNVELNKTS